MKNVHVQVYLLVVILPLEQIETFTHVRKKLKYIARRRTLTTLTFVIMYFGTRVHCALPNFANYFLLELFKLNFHVS